MGKGKSSTQKCQLVGDMWSFPGGYVSFSWEIETNLFDDFFVLQVFQDQQERLQLEKQQWEELEKKLKKTQESESPVASKKCRWKLTRFSKISRGLDVGRWLYTQTCSLAAKNCENWWDWEEYACHPVRCFFVACFREVLDFCQWFCMDWIFTRICASECNMNCQHFNIGMTRNVTWIVWNYPAPSSSHHQDYSIFSMGIPINLHLRLRLGGGYRMNCQFLLQEQYEMLHLELEKNLQEWGW